MKGKRYWRGERVWTLDADGTKRKGTLWWTDDTSVVIREDGRVGLVTLAKDAEGALWWFAKNDRTK